MTDWKTHEIQQLNGKAERIKLPAKLQNAYQLKRTQPPMRIAHVGWQSSRPLPHVLQQPDARADNATDGAFGQW